MTFFLKVSERSGVLRLKCNFGSRKSLESNDPWRNCSEAVFGRERTKRNIFPSLEISETPIVQNNKSENVVPGLIDSQWFSKLIGSSSDECSHFDLEVQSFALGKGWQSRIFGFDLTSWTSQRSSRGNNRRSSSVIADRDLQPILVQGISWASNDGSNIEGMRA